MVKAGSGDWMMNATGVIGLGSFLLLLIARGISNLISVDKYILNLFNSTSNILLGMILNVLFLITYYSLMLVLGVDEIFILLLPILLSEIGLLYTFRQKANMALR